MGSPHFSVQAAMRIGENIVARGSDTLPLDYSVTAGLTRREIRDELGFMVVYAGLDDSFIEVDATENAENVKVDSLEFIAPWRPPKRGEAWPLNVLVHLDHRNVSEPATLSMAQAIDQIKQQVSEDFAKQDDYRLGVIFIVVQYDRWRGKRNYRRQEIFNEMAELQQQMDALYEDLERQP